MQVFHLLLDKIVFDCECLVCCKNYAVRIFVKRLRDERWNEQVGHLTSALAPEEMLDMSEFILQKECMKIIEIRAQWCSHFCHSETRVLRIDAGDLSHFRNLLTTPVALTKESAFLRLRSLKFVIDLKMNVTWHILKEMSRNFVEEFDAMN